MLIKFFLSFLCVNPKHYFYQKNQYFANYSILFKTRQIFDRNNIKNTFIPGQIWIIPRKYKFHPILTEWVCFSKAPESRSGCRGLLDKEKDNVARACQRSRKFPSIAQGTLNFMNALKMYIRHHDDLRTCVHGFA